MYEALLTQRKWQSWYANGKQIERYRHLESMLTENTLGAKWGIKVKQALNMMQRLLCRSMGRKQERD